MKIGMICLDNTIKHLPRWVGGSPLPAYELAKQLHKQGHKINFVTYNNPDNPNKPDSFMNLLKAEYNPIDIIKKIFKLFKDSDIIHIHNLSSTKFLKMIQWINKQYKRKIIFTLYNENYNPLIDKIADKIIVTSKFIKDKIKSKKAIIIPVGISEEFFKIPFNRKHKKIICTSLKQLPEEMELFYEIKKHIKSEIDLFSRTQGDIKGYKDMGILLKDYYYYLLPLPKNHKRSKPPLSVLEAMAAGMLVLTTSYCGTDEFVKHCKTGILLDKDISKKKPNFDTIRKAARKSMEQYRWDNIIKMYKGVYE